MPFYASRLDLPEAYAAAGRIGRMWVSDKIDWPGVRRFAVRWALMAHQTTGVDRCGAEARFCWAAQDAAAAFERDQDEAARDIKTLIRPLIAAREPWNSLMAQAHDVNGARGFPLTEADVTEIVRAEIYFALPTAPRGARHG